MLFHYFLFELLILNIWNSKMKRTRYQYRKITDTVGLRHVRRAVEETDSSSHRSNRSYIENKRHLTMNALRLAATRLAPRVAHNRAAFTSTARLLQSNPCEFLSELLHSNPILSQKFRCLKCRWKIPWNTEWPMTCRTYFDHIVIHPLNPIDNPPFSHRFHFLFSLLQYH